MRTLDNCECNAVSGGDALEDVANAALDLGAAAGLAGAVPVAVGCAAFAATIYLYEAF